MTADSSDAIPPDTRYPLEISRERLRALEAAVGAKLRDAESGGFRSAMVKVLPITQQERNLFNAKYRVALEWWNDPGDSRDLAHELGIPRYVPAGDSDGSADQILRQESRGEDQ